MEQLKSSGSKLLDATMLIQREKELASYQGEDRVVKSDQIAKILADQPHLFSFKSKIPSIDDWTEGFEAGELIVVSGLTGQGKCHGVGTEILMYDGTIKKVEDIKIGDSLMGDDSTPRLVQSTTVGTGELFEIKGKPGVSYTANKDHILCLKRTRGNKYRHENHNWLRKDRKGEIKEITVSDFINGSNAQRHLYKGYRVPVSFDKKELNVEPYFMGLWLGDGDSSSVRITNADQEVEEYLKKYALRLGLQLSIAEQKNNKSKLYSITGGKRNFGRGFSLQAELRKCGVIGNKHIPKNYKTGDIHQRLELLAGVIDSDGFKNTEGYCVILKSLQLSKDIIFVAQSVGLSAYFIKSRVINGETYYRISINGECSIIPVKIKRKKAEIRKQIKDASSYGITINPIGVGKYYGFQITGNGRYLLGDCSVTHNTTFCQTLSFNFFAQNIPSLWFSYEMTYRQFLKKMQEDLFVYMPLILKDRTMDWLQERIHEAKLKYGVRAVFIDHLHFLVDMAKIKNPSLEIGSIIRNLKRIALELNVTIFLIAHLTKTKFEEEPELDAIRDSSFIPQDSDQVYIVWRQFDADSREFLNKTYVKLCKSRRTGTMGKKVLLTYHHQLYWEEDSRYERSATNSYYESDRNLVDI